MTVVKEAEKQKQAAEEQLEEQGSDAGQQQWNTATQTSVQMSRGAAGAAVVTAITNSSGDGGRVRDGFGALRAGTVIKARFRIKIVDGRDSESGHEATDTSGNNESDAASLSVPPFFKWPHGRVPDVLFPIASNPLHGYASPCNFSPPSSALAFLSSLSLANDSNNKSNNSIASNIRNAMPSSTENKRQKQYLLPQQQKGNAESATNRPRMSLSMGIKGGGGVGLAFIHFNGELLRSA